MVSRDIVAIVALTINLIEALDNAKGSAHDYHEAGASSVT
jgi:hypothetical protein